MQINRLFEMVYLLLSKDNVTAGELAKHFEVSPRTIYRDVELLSSAGIPIYMTKGKGGGISLLPDFVLNKTVLTEDEKADILSALGAMDAVSPQKTDTAVKKLSSLFGSTDSDWVEVDFSGWANAEEESKVFTTLKNAILKKYAVEFLYHGSGSNMQRVVEPLKLVFKGQGWYLYNLYRLDGEYRLSTPKTKSSARVIALPPQLVEILREQKVWQDERRKAVGSRWLERRAVFTGSYGEYMAKSYINLQFKQLLKKHNFPDIHIHDLRHANASLLINMGVPVKVISEHLGHSDTRTTETIYAHVFAETMVQASNAISEALATTDI